MFTKHFLTVGPISVMCLLAMQAQNAKSSISSAQLEKDSREYAAYDSGNTAEEIIASGTNFDTAHNTFLIVNHPNEEVPPGHAPIADPLIEFKTLTYNSDLIVLATPKSRTSALTDSHKFIFSDYEVRIDAVVKDRSGLFNRGSVAIVTRPGGEIVVGASKVRGIETEFPLFHLGEQYLFFLHKIDTSGSYKVNASEAYLIDGSDVKPGRRHPKVDTSGTTLKSILGEVQVAIADDRRNAK